MPTDEVSSAYVEKTFAETMALVEETRDLIVNGEARDATDGLDADVRMRAARDLSRLTNRMTAAVSILLLFKAFESGQGDEIDNPEIRLKALYAEISDPEPENSLRLSPEPVHLVSLLNRAEDAMKRIDHVCDLLRRDYLAPAS